MAGVLDSVNQRTQLVGQNRLELLLFSLGGRQLYGINVFKVKEVLQCPHLNEIPKRNPVVRGVAHIRGGTIPIMDMRQATGASRLENIQNCFVIITEYNRSTQGFLVSSVERIVNMNWSAIHPPPKGAGKESYLTAVTEVDGRLVEIIDVEKILAEVSPLPEDVSDEVRQAVNDTDSVNKHVLIVDDSAIARKQIQNVIQSLGVRTTVMKNGQEALDFLLGLLAEGKEPYKELLMVISDIEMPEMDGYTFTAEVRAHPGLSQMHIVLHTSLSGIFNEVMVKKVGANDFLAKFHPDELAKRVSNRIQEMKGQHDHQ
jgi:two-component system chemotaxis response regulator CheV